MILFLDSTVYVYELSVNLSVSSAQLTWKSDSTYSYEVVYVAYNDTEHCMGIDTLPDGYTTYANITSTFIDISDLRSNTCYVFAVRTYVNVSHSIIPGNWIIISGNTGMATKYF